MSNNFYLDVLNIIKSNLGCLPRFCRLLIYELLLLYDYKKDVITVSTLTKQGHPIPEVSLDYPKEKLDSHKTAQMYLNKLQEMLGVKN